MPLLENLFIALRFYTRLPTPAAAGPPDFSRIAGAAPVAGALVGAIGAAALLAARLFHLPAFLAATASVAAMAAVTGALHEDGLADIADGFGGGASREAKLAILRDSRLGAYGVLTLSLGTMARVGALGAMVERGAFAAACALIFVAASSRVLGLAPMLLLRPARGDGAGAASTPPTRDGLWRAFATALIFALLPWLAGVGLIQIGVSVVAALAGVWLLTRLAERQIGGYTGDVLGAAQQIAEIFALIVLSAQ